MTKKDVAIILIVYALMLAGMTAKAVYDDLMDVQAFELRNLLIPFIVSPMVYGAIYRFVVVGSTEIVLVLIFGFQNGFFWQDVLGQLGPTNAP
jgi:hypothetical protein